MNKVTSFLFFIGVVFSLASSADSTNKPLFTGTFVGMSGHESSGGFSVYRDGQGYSIRFHADFLFDGAPDPRLGFGKGKYLPTTEFAKLTHLQGEREYRLPLSSQLEQYSDFWIWCEKFSVPIGRVDLK
jgi:hypothetical protein